MKKILITMATMLICFIVGCEPEDYNVHGDKSSEWNICYEGTIVSKSYIDNKDSYGDKAIQIQFSTGDIMTLGHLYNASNVKEGQIGALYKWENPNSRSDELGYFVWEESKNLSEKESDQIKAKESDQIKAKESPKKIEDLKKEKDINNEIKKEFPNETFIAENKEWKDSSVSSPVEEKIVLVYLSDNIITTGYVSKNGDWILGYYKNKLYRANLPGKGILTNVKMWRDIEGGL